MNTENLIFPKGEIVSGNNFTGTTWLKMLATDDANFDTQIYNVTFEAGARNAWHLHPGGQIFLVTDGEGYYQEKGKPVQLVCKGDVVEIKPNVVHWHGATPNSSMTHVGITTQCHKGEATWLSPVTDEEYNNFFGDPRPL